MTSLERDVRVADGRTLRVLADGNPHGRPVFVLHGTPGSRLLYRKHVEDAARRGLRLIGYDRPGYGGSTPMRGRRVADAAHDVRAIADAMDLGRFAVWGHSGGGHHALACAAVLPERVVAAASLAADAPYTEVIAEGGDWFRGMSEWHAQWFQAMLADPSEWEAHLEAVDVTTPPTLEQLRTRLSPILSEVDRAALSDELLTFTIATEREGQRGGLAGGRDDSLAEVHPWGFDLAAIRVPLQLWHGKHDRFVPFWMGGWLARRLPDAESHLEPDEGHVSLFEHRIADVHEWLAAHF